MELRQLRYFIAVADALHFTKAAEQLGMAQPPLSQQIRKLEREVGAPLFHRLSRGIELTEAGRRLREDAQQVLDAAEQALSHAQSAARGISGRIRLGFATSAVFHAQIAMTLRDYRSRYPQVELAPHESDSPSLVEAVHEGRLDAAFLRLPVDTGELQLEKMVDEPMRVVLPVGHRLAGCAEIDLAELAGEPLILSPRWTGPALYDAILDTFRQAGIEPLLGQESPQVPTCANMVAGGFGISLVPESICQVRSEGVSYHAIKGISPQLGIALATRRNPLAPTLRNLILRVRAERQRHEAAGLVID
ncbi:LysR family transcriptional regulator [Frateuria aurantia]|uniref:Transcriptional regulator n=1 Tax=Frateuria aurantia (strain ATCC 33424 / DSM 6220 / KCTC 2777 / LMG 1558 / NBRC 3245 / NCIMB 13370) TaxID=767434 RepID=H8KYH5_FRAAD|nr:LysR family transcriptional regulator [Frateuria aurantia]AFC86981.1 transcriptional regulator [Frateuria aurantia DSM 6220]